MAGPWLYAIAAAARRDFEVAGGRRIAVNASNYAGLVKSGQLIQDRWWNISRNWKNVEAGDEIFVYTGDQNLGIVGYAKAKRLEKRSGIWHIDMDFVLSKCRALRREPIPAEVVRSWIPFPRGNVLSLAEFTEELYPRLPWNARRHALANA